MSRPLERLDEREELKLENHISSDKLRARVGQSHVSTSKPNFWSREKRLLYLVESWIRAKSVFSDESKFLTFLRFYDPFLAKIGIISSFVAPSVPRLTFNYVDLRFKRPWDCSYFSLVHLAYLVAEMSYLRSSFQPSSSAKYKISSFQKANVLKGKSKPGWRLAPFKKKFLNLKSQVSVSSLSLSIWPWAGLSVWLAASLIKFDARNFHPAFAFWACCWILAKSKRVWVRKSKK